MIIKFCSQAWLVFILAGGLFAQGPETLLSEKTREVGLTDKLFVLRDPDGQITPEEAWSKWAEFRLLPENRVNIGFTSDAIWLRFTLRSEAEQATSWMIELPSARLDRVDWFVFVEGRVADSVAWDPRHSVMPRGYRYPYLPLTLAPGETAEVFLRLTSEASIVVPMRIFSPAAFQFMERNREWSRGLFFSYIGALAIFGLLLAGVTRNQIFLCYSLIVASLWVDALCMTGTWAWLGLPAAAFMERQGLVMNGILCMGFVVLFQLCFFPLRQTLPRLDAVLRGFLFFCLAFLLAVPFLPFHAAKLVQVSLAIGTYLGTAALSFYFLIRGFRPARLFFFGWLGFWLLYTFLLLQVLGVLPFLSISPSLVEKTFAGGVTIFLLALAGWVRQIRRENEQAHNRELAMQKEMLERLEREVTERTADLREAKENAEQANRFKGLFLANMSHEIRTPLSALVGLSQAMWMQSSKYALPEEFSRFLNQIRSGGQYLNLILTNLLDVSAAEAGRTPVRWQEIRLGDWADSVRDLLDPIARNQDIRLAWRRDFDADCVFRTDPVRLTQILLNIVHNAIKFSETGRQVEIGIREREGALKLTVRDEGPGILETDLQAIFRAFAQSDAQARVGEQGVGLGLSVVRLNVDLLGGRVLAENEACGGALFTVTFPVREKTDDDKKESVCAS